MTPFEYLQLLYPHLAPECLGGVPSHDIASILLVAEAHRPKCLSEDLQNLAQAHYAAHLLVTREAARAGGASRLVVVEEAAEAMRRRYQSAASLDPRGTPTPSPLDEYLALKRRCRGGAIISGGLPYWLGA